MDANVVAVIDADLQHPPELLPVMYSLILQGYDVVIASRYVKGGKIEDWSLTRELMSYVVTMLAHLLILETRRVKDVFSGYFMIKKGYY